MFKNTFPKLLLEILCGKSILDSSHLSHLYLSVPFRNDTVLGTDSSSHCEPTVIKNKPHNSVPMMVPTEQKQFQVNITYLVAEPRIGMTMT